MLYKQFGNPNNPTIVLIHGGGVSWWMWQPQIGALQNDYHIITPIIEGHGEAADTEFTSIQSSAQNIMSLLDELCGGKVFAICGLSIGAQITVKILSQRPDITQKAVIESALVIPMRIGKSAGPLLAASFPLIKRRWFARLQAKQLYLPESMFEDYYTDSIRVTKQSLLNITESNAGYTLPDNFAKTAAEVAVLCGAQEYGFMKRSAQMIAQAAPHAVLKIIPKCGHGVSIKYPERYISFLTQMLQNDNFNGEL